LTVYTIGHSTRTFAEFLALLRAHDIVRLADIRTVPRSRRHPHFSRENLGPALIEHDITYEHFPELGGLRHPRRDSPNVGWRNESFRGYADHMQTAEFERGLQRLLEYASHTHLREPDASEGTGETSLHAPTDARLPRTVVMCAEAVWWRCHRALLADALVVRGVEVCHILSAEPARPHQLCEFARTAGTTLTYIEDTRQGSLWTGTENDRHRSK
jgi:uncharacterized protein (DUF488 family)